MWAGQDTLLTPRFQRGYSSAQILAYALTGYARFSRRTLVGSHPVAISVEKIKSPLGVLFFPLVGRAGFEPAKAEPTDLQSAAFDRFATDPSSALTSLGSSRLCRDIAILRRASSSFAWRSSSSFTESLDTLGLPIRTQLPHAHGLYSSTQKERAECTFSPSKVNQAS